MSAKGAPYRIPCARGGAYYSPNYDAVPPESCVDPSKNINLDKDGRTKRGGTTHVNTVAVAGPPTILNGFDFRLKDATQFVCFHANDGNLYKDSTTTIKTGLSTNNGGDFVYFANTLFHTDGEHIPQTWNGVAAATSDITGPAADWTGSNYPRWVLKHGRGASQRLWFFGVPNFQDCIYYTDNNDGNDVVGGGKIIIDTGDGEGIVGGIEWGERLIFFGKRKAYILNDEDTTVANWGYSAVLWEGGVAHHKLLIKTPNDIIAMAEDGEIYSVTSVTDYGDYKQASISRPAFIHQWIADNVNLAQIAKFHAIYDPTIRAVRFWVVRNGKTDPDTCLTFFIDRPAAEAWMIHDNLSYRSGFDAQCSFLVRKSVGLFKVYTGDNQGFIWELETTAKNDNSNGYDARFRTPPLAMDQPRIHKRFRRGWIVFNARGDYSVTVNWWVDNVQKTSFTCTTTSVGGTYGGATYGTSVYGGQEITDEPFDLGDIGKRLQFELLNSNADEDFYISQILIDAELLAARVGKNL